MEGDNHNHNHNNSGQWLLQQQHQMDELRRQLQQHAIHPAPVPYPAPPHSSSGTTSAYSTTNNSNNYLGRHPAAPLHQQQSATDHHLLHHQHQHHHHPYSQHNAVRHNSASQASDTLRRRSVPSNSMNNNNNHDSLRGVYSSSTAASSAAADEGDASVSSDASFRFSGLEMPSTDLDNDLLNAGSDHPTKSSYYHSKAGLHHNVNSNHHHQHHHHSTTATSAGQRLNQSLSNIITTNVTSAMAAANNAAMTVSNHSHLKNRHSRSSSSRSRSRGSDDDDDTTTATSSSPMAHQQQQRRRSSYTPQHQLDRRNSRRRVVNNNNTTATTSSAIIQRSSTTSSAASTMSASSATSNTHAHTTTVPNRYYISGKSVQTEWSSPTRQRHSRTSTTGNISKHHKGAAGAAGATNYTGKPKATVDDANNISSTTSMGSNHHHHLLHHHSSHQNNNNNNNNNHILVLPSISIPNGGTDDYHRHHAIHPSQIKPPAFPQRRACVQASSALCTVSTFKWCVVIQIVLVIPLFWYVFDAHAQKKSAKLQLQQHNEEHEQILNQMMWIDQAAKKMTATNKARQNILPKRGIGGAAGGSAGAAGGFYGTNRFDGGGVGMDSDTKKNTGDFFESYYADNSATEDLRDSVHKLRSQMRDMQYRIQQNSKARITEKYGEGPIRVYIHPEPEDDPIVRSATTTMTAGGAAAAAADTTSTTTSNMPQKLLPQQEDDQIMTSEVAIELFIEDTPHAVSTFLYQIERGHWKRVQMNWRSETSILSKPGSTVTSGMGDWAQTSRLEFLEQFPIKHCEVSLVQQGQMGVLSLKINLVEVPFQEHEEVCIGRLINDRLILPKSRGYFMAGFTTTPNNNVVEEEPKKRPQQEEEEVVVMAQPPKHEPPPPLPVPPGEEQAIEQQQAEGGGRITRDNLRGRRVGGGEPVDNEGEDVPPGQQIVPPLQPPGDDVPEDGL